MRYKLSFSILPVVLGCSWGFSAFCFHHSSDTSATKTFTIACPVVENQELSSGQTLDYKGHQWRIQLTNFAEDAIPMVKTKCANSNDATKNGNTKTDPTAIGTCQVAAQNKDNIINGQVHARKVMINTVSNLTYTCYSSLVDQSQIFCHGYMKPKIKKGNFNLTEAQFESETQFRFVLKHENDISCDCNNTTLTCHYSSPKSDSSNLPS